MLTAQGKRLSSCWRVLRVVCHSDTCADRVAAGSARSFGSCRRRWPLFPLPSCWSKPPLVSPWAVTGLLADSPSSHPWVGAVVMPRLLVRLPLPGSASLKDFRQRNWFIGSLLCKTQISVCLYLSLSAPVTFVCLIYLLKKLSLFSLPNGNNISIHFRYLL